MNASGVIPSGSMSKGDLAMCCLIAEAGDRAAEKKRPRMRVDGQQALGLLVARFRAPDLGLAEEEPLITAGKTISFKAGL